MYVHTEIMKNHGFLDKTMRRNVDTYARNLGTAYAIPGSKLTKTVVPVLRDTFATNHLYNLA